MCRFHFHESKHQMYNNTKFKLLDIGEFFEVKFNSKENE